MKRPVRDANVACMSRAATDGEIALRIGIAIVAEVACGTIVIELCGEFLQPGPRGPTGSVSLINFISIEFLLRHSFHLLKQ